tara:strand:- start:1691 stop:2236 length:546 start_codon:yes stop_codon:yes gene_type:complete
MIFSKKKNSILIEKIYQNIIQRSRLKFFYLDKQIEDTFESRFDLIIFHSFIIFQFFRENKIKDESSLSQNLFDFMFKDFENNLREMGFGDVAVNKKMKVFISAFYGRISSYSKGIKLFREENDRTILYDAICNNIYKNKNVNSAHIDFFIEYLLLNISNFRENSLEDNIKNKFSFISYNNI